MTNNKKYWRDEPSKKQLETLIKTLCVLSTLPQREQQRILLRKSTIRNNKQ